MQMVREESRTRWLVAGAVIVAAWALVALAWTPPTVLVQQMMHSPDANGPSAAVFVYVLLGFVPWMAATPLILFLGRRFAISEGHVLRPVVLQVLAGIAIVPSATLAGTTLGAVVMQQGRLSAADVPHILAAATITSFYSIPTYIAVAAIAQAIAYFERYRWRERLLARAQLKALQAQINPHFLFNTLNAISALGYRDPARADAALSQLSELMRQTLGERPQEVALCDEIAFARGYADLYALLLGDGLKVAFDIDGAVWNAAVPVMLLQPLIENAVVHGVARRNGGGQIALSARTVADRLTITITNDAPEIAQPSNGTGIGLANVRERLGALYGEAQTLELARDDGRVTVTLSLPLREAAPA
ncbi:MAG: histidine kinase [Alphaproteobacteria bacterium]|nr:histidine kinase [Alphaproteobacteria bacterium]